MSGRYCSFNKFFSVVDTNDTCLSCDIARESCSMVLRWPTLGDFLCPVYSASHVQHVSDVVHPKFALRPHHVWKYDIQSVTAYIRRGKKERKKEEEETIRQKYNVRICYAGQP